MASRGKTILVAEDFDDIRRAMKILIELHGYNVVEAANGREAVQQAKESVPDLILMDIAMPVYDGIEATRLIHSDPQLSTIPIVAVTSFSQEFHDEALAAGCIKVIQKSAMLNDLQEVLNNLLP